MLRPLLSVVLCAAMVPLVSAASGSAPVTTRRVVLPAFVPAARVASKQLSTDPFTNSTSQHKTELEPDVFAYGTTEVAAFQEGRFYDGGSSDVGWATSTNAGKTWSHGVLPGITRVQNPSNPYDRDTDPAVAYDSKHGLWLIATLPLIDASSAIGQMPLVSASADGKHWMKPVLVAPNNGDYIDKDWIACDNWSKSPYLGRCYVEFDDVYQGDAIMMSTSTNGGQSWSAPYSVGEYGLGGVPQVLPNGTVVVPYSDDYGGTSAFVSSDGGKSWGNNVLIATVNWHGTAGNMRTEPLPSSAIDGSGRLYVVWQDCSFRANCAENDIVMSTTTDGTNWTAESRIPIDPVNSSVDHFIPGIAADITTGASGAHLGLTYYYFPQTNCPSSSCQLLVGYVGSTDGGQTWSAPKTLTQAMNVAWIAQTDQGNMVGDYIATAFSSGVAHGIFAIAKPPSGSTLDEYAATNAAGLPATDGMMRFSSRGERPLPGAHSDTAKRYPPGIYHAFGNE